MNLQKTDKELAQVILRVYRTQKSFDNSVIIVFENPNGLTVGNERISLSRTSTVQTLRKRLFRLKEKKVIHSFEKQASSKIIKVLMREIRKQKSKKAKKLSQLQLQLS